MAFKADYCNFCGTYSVAVQIVKFSCLVKTYIAHFHSAKLTAVIMNNASFYNVSQLAEIVGLTAEFKVFIQIKLEYGDNFFYAENVF